jgi:hypothetical protein
MIHVCYDDGTFELHQSIEEAEEGIRETICGCNFAISVESVIEVTDTGELTTEFSCDWTVKLVKV